MAYVKGEKMESGIWRLADKEDLYLAEVNYSEYPFFDLVCDSNTHSLQFDTANSMDKSLLTDPDFSAPAQKHLAWHLRHDPRPATTAGTAAKPLGHMFDTKSQHS